MHKRVLVVSHNVFSKTSSMGKTLSGFFEEWDTDKIAQLYFHSEIPTVNICENYYRITDFDLVKAILKMKISGRRFNKNDINYGASTTRVDTGVKTKIYQNSKKRKPYMYVMRNLLWKFSNYKFADLYNWVKEFNPEVIFFASGDFSFAYDIVLKLSKKFNIPIVTYVCDDYYINYKKGRGLLWRYNHKTFSGLSKKIFENSNTIVSICDKLGQAYENIFTTKYTTIMTTGTAEFQPAKENDRPIVSYIGNFGYDRIDGILDIGRVLKKYGCELDVYTAEKREEIIKQLTKENGIVFKGEISAEKVKKVIAGSDVLVHTESFKAENIYKVQYSVSTKIADSLSSGRCLLAYGPSDVASIEYLKENNCACVVTDKDDLDNKLSEIIRSKDIRNMYANKALITADKYHNLNKNLIKFKEIIKEATNV